MDMAEFLKGIMLGKSYPIYLYSTYALVCDLNHTVCKESFQIVQIWGEIGYELGMSVFEKKRGQLE